MPNFVNFYNWAVESIPTGNTNWVWLCMAREREALQRVVKTVQNIIGVFYWVSAGWLLWDICTEPKDNTRAGYHQVPCNMILSRYFAHNNDNITIQWFCDNWYIARNFIHDTSRYLCHWRNSEFIDCTESVSHELWNTVNQFHVNDSQVKQSVYCTVALLNTHTDHNLNIIK